MKAAILILLISSNLAFGKSEVFFAPDDKPTNELIRKINRAKNKIHAAVYMITDKNIAQALINAKNKHGIDVQIVTDLSNLENPYSKIDMLKSGGIDIFTFHSKPSYNKNHDALMHNKFALLDNNVWTGSFNWTVSANKKNQENVFVTDDQKIYKRYEKHFDVLKKRCVLQRGTKHVLAAKPTNKKAAALKRRLKNMLTKIRAWARRS